MSRAEGLRQASSGIEKVSQNADPAWKACALQMVYEVCIRQKDFIVNDVWQHFKKQEGEYAVKGVHNTSAMGPVMLAAKRAGYCTRTSRFRSSGRSTNHGNPEAIWKSRLFYQGLAGVLK